MTIPSGHEDAMRALKSGHGGVRSLRMFPTGMDFGAAARRRPESAHTREHKSE